MTSHICDKPSHCIACELTDDSDFSKNTTKSPTYKSSMITMGLIGIGFTGIIAYNCYKWWK